MLRSILIVLVAATTIANANTRKGGGNNDPERSGRLFSLFNIVQFQNVACNSQQRSGSSSTSSSSTLASANRIGTCFASSECKDKGGKASGSCAAGFGSCCVFVNSGGGAVTQNCTYLQNPGFPATFAQASSLAYNIQKNRKDVCSLRLDFETFTTLGPLGTSEANGGQCQDTLTFSTSSRSTFPVICGSNAGQHVYLDLGRNSGDKATLTFAFATVATAAVRMWDIKVTQVLCGINNPPDGCFQYFTSTTGQIMTFNFANSASTQLANQQYTSCVRRGCGFCCIQYQTCTSVDGSFSINEAEDIPLGIIDTGCTGDFVQISGASASCSSSNAAMVSRICGTAFTTLNAVVKGAQNLDIPICDCSQPFDITFVTDSAPDTFSGTVLSRGVCLQYQQLPCSTTC